MRKLLLLMLVISVISCKQPFDAPNQSDTVVSVSDKTIDQLDVPDGFNFQTINNVDLTVSAKDNSGQLMKNIPFKIYLKKQDSNDTIFLMSAVTNTEGVFKMPLKLGSDIASVVAVTDYIGLPSSQELAVSSETTKLNVVFGDDNDINEPRKFVDVAERGVDGTLTPQLSTFTYMGSYDANGVPRYLMPKGDAVSQDILNMVNSTLPEGAPLTASHPEYLTNTTQRNVVLTKKAEVWVTFVAEGAGYRNALGYYSYPTNNPPKSPADVKNLNVIFPNASFIGSGGGLKTGDKVYLGIFEAGTTVAWFVVPNGWKTPQNNVSDYDFPIHYSDKELNTFTTSNYRQHVVTLLDPNRELVLVGFEDIGRPYGDSDFNDAVFYATVTPFEAVDKTNMAQTSNYGQDSDGDGIPNTQDVEPLNSKVAFYNYAPAQNQYNTLAFEDFWPQKGDYDMNDMVVDYNVHEKLNAANKITQIKFSLKLRAMGASFRNGFGIELPVSSSKIESVTGTKIKDNYITLNINGTEAGQNKAVIIAFDNGYSLMSPPVGALVNTQKEYASIAPYTFDVVVNFSTPVSRDELGSAPYNPFIICDKERGREVHLPGNTPTNLANTALFKTGDDDSGNGKYYQTKRNLPWAIHVSSSFQYPIEKAPINQAFLKFNEWSESGGTKFPDWFQNKTNYRKPEKIY